MFKRIRNLGGEALNKEIGERLRVVQKGEVPSGYKRLMNLNFVIPEEWNESTIIQNSKMYNGDRGKNYPKADEIVLKGIPFINAGDLVSGKVDLSTTNKITKEKYDSLGGAKIREKDIIYCLRGSLGKNALVLNFNEGTIASSLVVIRPETILPEYLFYIINSDIEYRQRILNDEGAAQPNLSAKNVGNFKIPIPRKSEQKEIARILSMWDRAIELKEKLIKEKKNQKKGLVCGLLSRKERLSGYNDKWRLIRLGDYLVKHTEKSTENNQYPVLTSSRKGIYFQKDYFDGNDVASKDNTGYNVVPIGYFTYRHMSDDLVFKFNINTIADRGIVSTLYPVFTTKDELDSDFLRLVLNEGAEFKKYALSQKQGGSRTYMYYSKLEELKIMIPTLHEQLAISELEKTARREVDLLEKEVELMKEQKKGLMQLLLTGIIRVNTQEN